MGNLMSGAYMDGARQAERTARINRQLEAEPADGQPGIHLQRRSAIAARLTCIARCTGAVAGAAPVARGVESRHWPGGDAP